ncbi:heterokaryon incompatibility protein-domain-containing protein [Macrophomina phaseolina]|uniref:Heterokaryon incompatibility protein-domain-containing protein n=1 Tax=Macrophomina phaseolina TaxID=35725 RepID=A0ABQ8GLN4_9PEZI|nr:heterokaryon incompatibility protein-domain-containing protein [Macrophomina phaseolina]
MTMMANLFKLRRVARCQLFRPFFLHPNEEIFVPTRLLDLEHCLKTDEDDGFVVLVRLGNPDESTSEVPNTEALKSFHDVCGNYAALSYRWGLPETSLKTTRANIHDHMSGIPVSSLAACLGDAVRVACKLKIRYLWVDALCIVQDDEGEDFKQESGRMLETYHCAFITMAAARSPSSGIALLQNRHLESADIRFKSSIAPTVSGSYCFSLVPEKVTPSVRAEDNTFGIDLESSTWDTRAWVFQEKIISNRVVIFGHKMIHVRCHDSVYSEDGRITRGATDWHENYSVDSWGGNIMSYSRRALTKQTDKLPAVSGLAKLVCQKAKARGERVEYLAGIWYDASWRMNFCWTTTSAVSYEGLGQMLSGVEHDSRSYVAPTWTWASRKEGADFRSESWRPDMIRPTELDCVIIENNVCSSTDKNPFGTVEPESHLLMRGRLSKDPPSLSALQRQHEGSVYQWAATLEACRPLEFSVDWHLLVEGEKARNMEDLRMFIVQISAVGGIHLNGLFLLQAHEKGAYYRVGSFCLGLEDHYDSLVRESKGAEFYTQWPKVDIKLI